MSEPPVPLWIRTQTDRQTFKGIKAASYKKKDNSKVHARVQMGDRGSRPYGKLLSYRFLSNTGPGLLEMHKATKPIFNVGPSSARERNANQMTPKHFSIFFPLKCIRIKLDLDIK